MTNKEITKVIFNNSEISALYYGDVLIWKKGNGSQSGDLNFSGVFNDTVTGSNNTVTATFEDGTTETINIPYDSTTKEFNYTFEKPLQKMKLENKGIYKSITHFPNQSNLIDCHSYFNGCSAENIDLSSFDASKATNMNSMFYNCQSLKTIDLSSIDTSKVTKMSGLFYNCKALKTIDLSSIDTSKATDMSSLFFNCESLSVIDLSSINTLSLNRIESMFYNCQSLKAIDLSSINTSKVPYMGHLFFNCNSLTELDLSSFNTANCTDMEEMFWQCSSLTTLDLSSFNTDRVTNMNGIFDNCFELNTIHFGNFNSSEADGSTIFQSCGALTTVTGAFEGTRKDLYLDISPLTNDSAMVFINGLEKVYSTKTIRFNPFVYDTLTEEQIAVATSKGWTVISA